MPEFALDTPLLNRYGDALIRAGQPVDALWDALHAATQTGADGRTTLDARRVRRPLAAVAGAAADDALEHLTQIAAAGFLWFSDPASDQPYGVPAAGLLDPAGALLLGPAALDAAGVWAGGSIERTRRRLLDRFPALPPDLLDDDRIERLISVRTTMLGLRPSAGGNEPPEKQPAPSGGSSAGPTAAAVAAATLLVQAVTELATAVAHAEVRTSIWGVDLCFTKEWAQRLAGPLLKLAGVGAAGVALVASGSLQAAINALPLVAALGPTPGAIIVGVLLVYAAVIAVQASRCPNGICIRVWWTDIVWPAFFVPPVVRCR